MRSMPMMLPWLEESPAGRLEAVRDTSLSKLVRDEMLRLILRGELAAGSRINEPDLAARLRISRVPVREALRELESSGLVASRKNLGTFVRVHTPEEVADLYELRGVLDGHAARRAAGLPDAPRLALVRKLAASIRDMETCARRADAQAYYLRNLAFHALIIEAAGNERVESTYRGLIQQLHLSRLRNLSRNEGMRVSTEEHGRIVDALKDGDPVRCRELAEGHVWAAHARLVAKADAPAVGPTDVAAALPVEPSVRRGLKSRPSR